MQQHRRKRLARRVNDDIGIPDIKRFREKLELKKIYELQDAGIATVTYLVDASGRLDKLCDSVGYGMPGVTLYASPQRASAESPGTALPAPAPAPNGLYATSSNASTWVFCKGPDGKEALRVRIGMAPSVSPIALSESR